MCSCIFTKDNIRRNEFSCRSDENTVVIRAGIKYASFTYTAAQLVDFISQWVQSAPSFVVGPSMSRVNVDTSCPTQLDSFLSEDCVSMDQGKAQSIGAMSAEYSQVYVWFSYLLASLLWWCSYKRENRNPSGM